MGKNVFVFLFLSLLILSSAYAGSYVAPAQSSNDPCPSCVDLNAGISAAPVGGFATGALIGGGQAGANPSSDKASSISSTGDSAKKLLSYFPDGDTKKAMQEYISILGTEKYGSDGAVALSNAGMASYFSAKFSDKKNSCVRDAARSFYEDVAAQIKSKTAQDPDCQAIDGQQLKGGFAAFYEKLTTCSGHRPGINDVAGAGAYKDLEPGWLWRLALKHSKGDPNSAMFLIGMCGHDDTAQGYYTYQDSSEESLDKIRMQCETTKQIKAKLDAQIKELAKNYDINQEKIYSLSSQASSYNQQIKTLQKQKSLAKIMACPAANSGFYTPQSLAQTADISDDVKKDIQKIQGDIGGAKNIPGKYYHVYGSAFMACQLIQNGVSPGKTTLIQEQAGRLYRGLRMCAANETNSKLMDGLSARMAPLYEKYKIKDPKQLVIAITKDIRSKKTDCHDAAASILAMPSACSFLFSFGIPADMINTPEFDLSDDVILKKVMGQFESSDATELYKKWYLGGGTVAGQEIPCSDIRVWGPADLTDPTKSFFGKIAKPKEWTDERYDKASKKLATWDVDFKWTIAQHEAGAKFAAQTCKKRGPNDKALAGICPMGAPDGTTEGSGLPGVAKPSDSNGGVR